MSQKIIIINGPNLNLLGTREPEIYGNESLEDLKSIVNSHIEKKFPRMSVDFYQSNTEGEIVNKIQESVDLNGIIINAGGLSHSSISILDALLSIKIPKIEVHISNLFSREEFRQNSYVSKGVDGFVCGFGINGYLLAIDGISKLI
ncbi:MAG: type II 3-dehydroquinate dehydratase [Candidatus Pelagibacterales bacterium]